MATIAGLLICFLVEKCCAQTEASQHKAAAIMNLIANLVDNFTHGLAVTSSFFISVQVGLWCGCRAHLSNICLKNSPLKG